MQCPRCGSEDLGVVQTIRNRTSEGKYSPTSDVRLQECHTCGKKISVDCSLALVQVFDVETLAKKNVLPVDYERVHLPRELSRGSRRQDGLFDGEVEQ